MYVARVVDRADQGFEIAPVALGGGSSGRRGRRRRLPVLIVLLVAIAIPAIAWIGPRIEVRPNLDLSFVAPPPTPTPKPTPRPTPVPSRPLATPLPEVTFGEGPRPTGPIAIDLGGIRLVDPQTGALHPADAMRVDRDAIFAAPNGDGWWCICFARSSEIAREEVIVEIRRIDAHGDQTDGRTVGSYTSTDKTEMDYYTRFDLELSPDGRTAYLASGTRQEDVWTFAIDAIELSSGTITAHLEVAELPAALPIDPKASPVPVNPQTYIAGPSIRLSADGSRLLLWGGLEQYSDDGQQRLDPHAWLIGVPSGPDDTSFEAPTTVGGAIAADLRSCNWAVWLSDVSVMAFCTFGQVEANGTPIFTTKLFGTDGLEVAHVDVPISVDSWIAEPIVDRANGLVYVWEPLGHVVHRIDVAAGRSVSLTIDPDAPDVGASAGAPALDLPPTWLSVTSDYRLYYGPQLLPEPRGTRLFAIGLKPVDQNGSRGYSFRSTGVFVVDSAAVALVDHWNALAAYGSIGISPDGAWLTAIGVPEIDAEGHPTNWMASLTIHDLADGRPVLRLGQLGGPETSVMQVPP